MIDKIKKALTLATTLLRLSIRKLMYPSRIKFKFLSLIGPFVELTIEKNANLILGSRIRIKSGGKIKVRKGACVKVGNNTSFNHNCLIVCREKISIGDNVQVGPNVLFYDHDHDYKSMSGLKKLLYKTAPIIIGDNVWIGANTVILRGTNLGNNCVIAAGSIVKGVFAENSLIIQKRETITEPIIYESDTNI